jgi:uncharacterized protein YecE (DUF72 family)
MKLHIGTSGYSYKEWKGTFYPEKLPAAQMLRYYAEQLPAVEINNTFYRLPRASVLQSWAEQVPEDFRFAIKASRRITHFKRLVEAGDETEYLLRTTSTLGERLGVILFQLPPNLRKDLSRLEGFLDLLPPGTRAAFEFRHPSWLEDDVLQTLRAHDLALCISDTAEETNGEVEPRCLSTAGWGYLRLRRPGYTEADLSAWAKRLRSQDWQESFVFFKHEEAGAGPKLAARFLRMLSRVPAKRRAPPEAPKRRRARA